MASGRQPTDEWAAVVSEIQADAADVRERPDVGDALDRAERAFTAARHRLMASGGRLRASLAAVDRASRINLAVPVASAKPGGSVVKRAVRSTIDWYVRFAQTQFADFAGAVTQALHAVADELDELRGAAVGEQLPIATNGAQWWVAATVDALASVGGRVVVDAAEPAAILEALGQAGVVADTDTADDALARCETGSLGGLVVARVAENRSPSGWRRLAAQSAAALRPAGVVAIVSFTPEAWARGVEPVAGDLAPGRPLHSETWEYLLSESGFASVAVHRGGADPYAALRDAAGSDHDATMGRAIADALYRHPDQFLVTAVRQAPG